MSYKDRIKEARLAAGLTQEELGKLIGKAKSTIAGYERVNGRDPDMETIVLLMNALNVDANFIFQDDDVTDGIVLSLKERDMIKKYRFLSEGNQKAVSGLLDNLYGIDSEQDLPSRLEPPPKRDSVEKTK